MSRRLKYRLLGLFSMLLVTSMLCQLCAQDATFSLENYTTAEGLAHNHINGIVIHSSGFVWVGTRNGLCRFDGYEFTRVDLPDHPEFFLGSVGPWVRLSRELPNGNLLISYIRHLDASVSADYEYNPITGEEMLFDSSRWSASQLEQGFPQIKYKGDTLLHVDRFGNRLALFRSGHTYRGFLTRVDSVITDISSSLHEMDFLTPVISTDYSKYFFFSVYNGLEKVSIDVSPFQHFLHNPDKFDAYGSRVRLLFPLDDSRLIASTQRDNLCLIDVDHLTETQIELVDEESNKPILVKYVQSAVQQSESEIWVAGLFFGLAKINLESSRIKVMKDVFNRTFEVLRINENTLMVSGVDDDGKLDLRLFDILSEKFTPCSLPGSVDGLYSVLHPADSQRVWIGFAGGLILYDWINQQVVRAYTSEKSDEPVFQQGEVSTFYVLNSVGVVALNSTQDGKLLIGLDQGGVDVLDLKSNAVGSISHITGLADNRIADIESDSTGYWISTFNGLSHVNSENGRIKNFYADLGLPHNEFNRYSSARSQDGRLWFGGMNGLTTFKPSEVLEELNEVNIRLVEANYFDKKLDQQISKSIQMDHDLHFSIPSIHRSCGFKFMLDDMSNSKRNSFFYRLEKKQFWGGRPSNWTENGNARTIQFVNLEAGSYSLYVKGVSAEGASSNIIELHLQVNEVFYKRWWFWCLLLVMAFLLVFGYYQLRLAQLKRVVEIRTKLSRDLHDDVGGLLSGLAYQMEYLSSMPEIKFKEQLQKMASSSRLAMTRMRDVVWALNTDQVTTQSFVDRVHDYATDLLEPLGISWSQELIHAARVIPIPVHARHDLLLILKEFLTNTVKHANASKVDLRVHIEDKHLVITISDDGLGMSSLSKEQTGLGMRNMKSRAKKIGAELTFISNDGLIAILNLPISA